MNKLKKIQYNCKHATFLIEKKQIAGLTLWERIELRIHLAGCSVCRTFQKQSILINRWLRELFQTAGQNEGRLDAAFKEELQERIEEELRK
jgi:hypothetical protein